MLDKRYDHQKVEQGKYQKWIEKGYFTAGDTSKTPFTIVIPPPNVTGKLHIGHACDTTMQDITIRYKRMQGYDALYLPGMDHAGIATQAKVMQRLYNEGVDVKNISREEFLKNAWNWKNEYAKSIHEQWAKMGLSLDYSRERFTLDEGLNFAVRKTFVDLYQRGLIYQGERIISWDPIQQTALSNVEVIHQDDEGFMYYFKYPVVDSNDYLIVATTRPETMFGDVCVVVNPKDERFFKYKGKKVINPANGDILPIIEDEYVDINFGTGAMKCTPAHDPNDFIIGKKYNLPMPIIFNKDATLNEKCGKYNGLDRFVAREVLIKNITNEGNFIKQEKIAHQVGHSERTGCVIEPMLSKQWFIKMKPLAEMSIANQKSDKKVNFWPERFENTFLRWMENIEDWCISRQLWWGHRIPAYYHKATGEIVVSMDPPKDIENYTQDPDVLDTWFSSGLWPFSTLGWPNDTPDFKRYYPTSTLITGYDIIFFWVSRMIFQGLGETGVAPFKDVVIHGLVRDSHGKKMSKSSNNGIDPLDVIEKYGVDALRYFISTGCTPGLDMRYIDEKVEASSNYLNKIWNSARYVLSILGDDFNPEILKKDKLSTIDKWIIYKLNLSIANITSNMDKYDYNAASIHLYNFVYDDFCSNYLEFSKVLLNGNDQAAKNATKQVLYMVLKSIICLISPFCPFISEELYLNLPSHKESINLESYPTINKDLADQNSEEEVEFLMSIIKEVRNYKIVNKLAPNIKLELKIANKSNLSKDFALFLERFTFSNVNFVSSLKDEKGDIHIYNLGSLCIENDNNKDELIARLLKDIEKEKSEISRGEKMLSNPSFISKAPKDKVEQEKEKLSNHQKALESLLEKLEKLKM